MASLSKLSIDKKEESYFTKQFNQTIDTIDLLNKVNTNNVKATFHVTGLKNIYREDKVEKDRVLTQKQALSNAKRVHNGFFVVKGVLDEK
jgi:aspartyl-tRNA(Asn)/glutamyl-tRNA(Gln) amidotransferase subunit C